MARLRTFIAVDVSRSIRERCTELQETLALANENVKWVEENSLHITLLFLGDVDDRDLNNVCKAVAKGCAGQQPFTLEIAGVGSFGPKNQPRTIWAAIALGAEELTALHDSIEAPLLAQRYYRREERRYSPHLTLGRVKGERDAGGLADALAEQTDWHGGECEVREVLVMSSQLMPGGPVYSVLSRVKLG